MGDNSSLSERIKELRKNMGLTQKEFAELINVSTVSVSSYETEAKSPSLDMVINIAQKCNVSIDWLCGLSNKQGLSSSIHTYDELFQLFINLLETNYESTEQIIPIIDLVDTDTSSVVLTLHDDVNLQNFFTQWCKMFELRCNKTIDNELYQLWIEKELSKFKNHKIDGIPF
jgi:transcriptional regulator with XRE-family HTH domain